MTTQDHMNDIAIVVKPMSEQTVKIGRRSSDRETTELSVNKEGDLIKSIHVKCKCGEHIDIQCVYPD